MARDHPTGSTLRGTNGTLYVLDGGFLRPFANSYAFDTWFWSDEVVSLTSVEQSRYGVGSTWGLRPGGLIRYPGSSSTGIVTDDGLRGLGAIRNFEGSYARSERGYASNPVASSDAYWSHPRGADLPDASNMAGSDLTL